MQGAQMLVSAFSDVAAAANIAERKILATRTLHDQVHAELGRVKEVHMTEILAMQQRLDAIGKIWRFPRMNALEPWRRRAWPVSEQILSGRS